MTMKKSLKLQSDEQGFAAIVIALILVLVLALLTVGFAQLARREQQGALDKLFANQAFYAAESGINDVQKLISSGATLPTSTGCQTLPNKDISTHGASYSCVIVNEEPPTLEYSSVESSQSKAVVFNTAAPINSIKIEWKSTNPAFSALKITAPGVFTPEPDWNSPKKSMAVLQIGLTDLSTVTRDALINNTFNTYGYPSSSALGTTPYVASNQANVVAADCSGSDYRCSLTITGLPANSNGFLLRMLDLYTTSDIRISAYASPSPAQVPLRGAQALDRKSVV